MKIFNRVILIIIIMLIMSSCVMHNGERPCDYPPAKWVSASPHMWFNIGENSQTNMNLSGGLVLDGQIIEIAVFFDYSDGVDFKAKGTYEPFTQGYCTFSPDKLVVIIDEERDNYLNGLCETITFVRVPLEE